MLAILVKAWDEINEKDVDEEVKMICYGFDTLSNKNGMQIGKRVILGCTHTILDTLSNKNGMQVGKSVMLG